MMQLLLISDNGLAALGFINVKAVHLNTSLAVIGKGVNVFAGV